MSKPAHEAVIEAQNTLITALAALAEAECLSEHPCPERVWQIINHRNAITSRLFRLRRETGIDHAAS